MAFVGCAGGGEPTDTVIDPANPGTTYDAAWWVSQPLTIPEGTDGGPDPIAQGATLVTVGPGQQLVAHDHCFGCVPTPPVTISIAGLVAGPGSITVAFTVASTNNGAEHIEGIEAVADYTATCSSSTGGATGSASGASSPITVTGLTNHATYTCTVTATGSGGVLATSEASQLSAVPAPQQAPNTTIGGSLPATGDGTGATALVALLLVVLGGIGMRSARRA